MLRAAVVGAPVGHSLSPVMHAAAYAHLGVDGAYGRHEVGAGRLAPFLAGLDATWRGLSVTMPLKEEALRVASWADPVAADVGGANTLVRAADGWHAYNTDVRGIEVALARAGVREAPDVLLLGAGATARSVVEAVAGIGAQTVTFATRSGARPETVGFARALGLMTRECTLDDVPRRVGEASLVVDTLPGRAADALADALQGLWLPPLLEVPYEGWPTRLARTFSGVGAPVASGLVMLAAQAAEQVRLMTGAGGGAGDDALIDVMLAAAHETLAAR